MGTRRRHSSTTVYTTTIAKGVVTRMTDRNSTWLNKTFLFTKLLKSVALALILCTIFVTVKQAQLGCDIIGLQDSDCKPNVFAVVLSCFYFLINILLAFGFYWPIESLVI